MVHRVKGVGTAATPDCHHGGSDFTTEQSAIGNGHQPRAIQESLHFSAHVGEVRGRAKEDGISGDHLLHAMVEKLILLAASGVLLLEALVAGLASADGGSPKLDELGLPAGGSQRR